MTTLLYLMNSSQIYKADHKKRGLCVDCPRKARAGKTLCKECSKKQVMRSLARNKKIYKYRQENKLCKRCGYPLVEGENLTCYNCGGTQKKVMVKNATH